MFDCHYDLLTYILMKKNEPDFLKNYCSSVYNDNNITGGIFNLFYMSESEMKEELGFEKEQIDVIQNLKEVKNYIDSANLFFNKINYIFGIEGLDYLEKIDDIETHFTGEYPTLIVHNLDQPGHVAEVASMLSHKSINIATLNLYRDKRGGYAVMVVETDQTIPEDSIKWLEHLEGVIKVTYLDITGGGKNVL